MNLNRYFAIGFLTLVAFHSLPESKAQNHPPSAQLDTFSCDIPDSSYREALRLIADKASINLVIPSSIDKCPSISIKLRDVTWRQALKVLLEPEGFYFAEERNVVTIYESSKEVSRVTQNPNHGFQIDSTLAQRLLRSANPRRITSIDAAAFLNLADKARCLAAVQISLDGDQAPQILIFSRLATDSSWTNAQIVSGHKISTIDEFLKMDSRILSEIIGH